MGKKHSKKQLLHHKPYLQKPFTNVFGCTAESQILMQDVEDGGNSLKILCKKYILIEKREREWGRVTQTYTENLLANNPRLSFYNRILQTRLYLSPTIYGPSQSGVPLLH